MLGQMTAERPQQDYYIARTIGRAKEHVFKQMQGSSAARAAAQPRQPETIAVEPQSSSGSALVPVEHLQSLVDLALDKRLGQPLHVKKACKQCGASLERQHFTSVQWSKSEPVCTSCSPVDERFQGRLLQTKPCARCQLDVARDGFSKSQWERGAASVCKACAVVRTTERDNSRVWSISLSQFTYLCFLILFSCNRIRDTCGCMRNLFLSYIIFLYFTLYSLILSCIIYCGICYIYILYYILYYMLNIYIYIYFVFYIILYCIIIYCMIYMLLYEIVLYNMIFFEIYN